MLLIFADKMNTPKKKRNRSSSKNKEYLKDGHEFIVPKSTKAHNEKKKKLFAQGVNISQGINFILVSMNLSLSKINP